MSELAELDVALPLGVSEVVKETKAVAVRVGMLAFGVAVPFTPPVLVGRLVAAGDLEEEAEPRGEFEVE